MSGKSEGKEDNVKFYDTSALYGTNVFEMWNELAKEISRDDLIKEFEEMHKNTFIEEYNNDANIEEEGNLNDGLDDFTKTNEATGPIDFWLQNLKQKMPDIGSDQELLRCSVGREGLVRHHSSGRVQMEG